MSTVPNSSDDRDLSKQADASNATAAGSNVANDAIDVEGVTGDQEEQQLRASIEHTRADMSETIDELQERLNPANVKEKMKERLVETVQHAKETIRDATLGRVEDMAERMSDTVYETRRGIVEMVKANPVPSAMVGVGLAWLWMNRNDGFRSSDSGWSRQRRGSRTNYSMSGGSQGRWNSTRSGPGFADEWDDDDMRSGQGSGREGAGVMANAAGQARGTASRIADKARETVHDVTDKAHQTAGYVAERAQDVARGAQNQARRVEETFNRKLAEAPLAVGAVALALGTAVGLAVPRTRMEDEWMGDARDTLMDKAQSVASDTLDKVGEMAERVTGEMAGDVGARGTQEPRAAV